MKRLAATGAMLALMIAAAAPSFADTAIGGDVTLKFMDASQTQTAAALQVNEGDATAVAGDVGSAADASISQSLAIDQWQWNGGF